MKALLWAVVGFLVVMWLLRGKASTGTGPATRSPAGGANRESEPMIQCAYCGIHMPESEAILASTGAAFCNEEHRLRHAAR